MKAGEGTQGEAPVMKALAVHIQPGVCIPRTTEMLRDVVDHLQFHLHKMERGPQSKLTCKMTKDVNNPWVFLRDATSVSKMEESR